jgi:hypothetical protein
MKQSLVLHSTQFVEDFIFQKDLFAVLPLSYVKCFRGFTPTPTQNLCLTSDRVPLATNFTWTTTIISITHKHMIIVRVWVQTVVGAGQRIAVTSIIIVIKQARSYYC